MSFLHRGKSHGHVVELLKGSGSNPTLLVQWRPSSSLYSAPSVHSNRSVTFGNSRPGSNISRSSSGATRTSFGTDYLPDRPIIGSDEHRRLARQFKFHVCTCVAWTFLFVYLYPDLVWNTKYIKQKDTKSPIKC